jgi:hypothetical protein
LQESRDGDFREAHLSTEPPCPQAPPRISQTHADGRWPESSGASPREGPQASFGLNGSNAWAPLSALPRLWRLPYLFCQLSRRDLNFSLCAGGGVNPRRHFSLKCANARAQMFAQLLVSAKGRASASQSQRKSATPSRGIASAGGSKLHSPLKPRPKALELAITSWLPGMPRLTGPSICCSATSAGHLLHCTALSRATLTEPTKKGQRDWVSSSLYQQFPPSLPGTTGLKKPAPVRGFNEHA